VVAGEAASNRRIDEVRVAGAVEAVAGDEPTGVTARQPSESGVDLPRPAIPRRHARRLLVFFDAVGVAVGFAVGSSVLRAGVDDGVVGPGRLVGAAVYAYLPLYVVAFVAYGIYRRERRRLFATNFPDLVYLAHALLAAGAATMLASHLLHEALGIGQGLTLTGVVAITAPVIVTVPAVRAIGGAIARGRGLIRSRVIILGSGIVADSVVRRLVFFDDIELLGCVDDVGSYPGIPRAVSGIGLLGAVSDLPALCGSLDVDRVIVAFSPTSEPALAATLRQLPPAVQISVVPRLFDLLTWRSHVDELHGLPIMDVAPPVLGPAHRAVKRALDLTIAVALLVALLPVWLVMAVLVKFSSPGPVLFRQQRLGRGGQPFWIYKFRTMRVGAEEEQPNLRSANEVDGPLFKIKHDPRVTRIGAVLRATSLDEVPQLLNVLAGQMSLVGPRPFVSDEAGQIDGWAARRFDVRPGMTGLWQVSGRNDLPFEELRRLDYAYVASWSLWWDLKIIWHTPASVIRRRGAY